MKATFYSLLTLLAFVSMITINSYAQVTKPGLPPSTIDKNIIRGSELIEYEKPELEMILWEDQENEELGFPDPVRIATSFPIGLTPETKVASAARKQAAEIRRCFIPGLDQSSLIQMLRN